MKLLKSALFILFVFISFSALAQDDNEATSTDSKDEAMPALKKEYYVFSPRVQIMVPHPISNKAFRKTFVGVYEVTAGLNIMVFKGAFIGVVGKTGAFKVTENKIPDMEANMQFHNAGIKVGTDMFVGDKNRMIFSAAVTAGKNWTYFNSFNAKTANTPDPIKGFNTSYVEPELNLYFLVEPNFGIGATLSYSFWNQQFNPYALNLNEWAQFDKENPGNIQHLSFGFGFYYSFLKKKTK